MSLSPTAINSIEALRASDFLDPLSAVAAIEVLEQPPFPLYCRLAHFHPACDGCRRDAEDLASSLEELA